MIPQDKRLIAVGVFIAFALVATLIWPGPGSPAAIERTLQTQAESALDEAGYAAGQPGGWARVEVSGQRAVLKGAAPTAAARDAAMAVVREAAGPGGFWRGGVTAVIDATQTPDVVKPFRFAARRTPDGLILTGHAPSQETRNAVIAAARAALGEDVPVNAEGLGVAQGAPFGVDWIAGVEHGLAGLSGGREGAVELVDAALSLDASAPDAGLATALRDAFEAAPAGFTASASITVSAPDPEPASEDGGDAPPALETGASGPANAGPLSPAESEGADPEAPAADAAVQAERDLCQERFAALQSDAKLSFRFNSDEILAESGPILDSAVTLFTECPDFRVEVGGHTDSTGVPIYNVDLSRRRAEAVAQVLREAGVAEDRVVAVGYGADRPIASNASARGRAQNRRIEFTVLD